MASVNVEHIARGTLDPGHSADLYYYGWGYPAEQDVAWFYTAVPDPYETPKNKGGFRPESLWVEVTRSWHGLWTDMSNFYSAGNLSRCVTVKNVGSAATAYHLLLTTAG